MPPTRITYAQVAASYPSIAKAVGFDASAMPRTRTRTPEKAALLRAVGIPAEQIGPVGPRRFFTTSNEQDLPG